MDSLIFCLWYADRVGEVSSNIAIFPQSSAEVIDMKQKRQKNEKGFTIALVFMVLMIVLLIGMASATLASRNLGFVNKDHNNTMAFYAAESGIARAISRLRDDDEWIGTETGSNGEQTLSFENVQVGDSDASYSVWVYNNFRGTSDITAYKGAVVPPGYTYILGVGSVGSSPFRKAVRYVGAMAKRTGPFEDMGIFSDKQTSFAGSIQVASYDSSTGQLVSGEANVGTNASDTGVFTIDGSAASIDGSIFAGPGSFIGSGGAIIIEGQPQISGDLKVLPREVPMPAPEFPENIETKTVTNPNDLIINLEPGKYDEVLTVSNKQNVILTGPGTYVLKGVYFTGKGILSVDTTNGPVKVIMDGDISFQGTSFLGGIANVNQSGPPKPTDLVIYGTDNCKNIAVGGNATAYAGIYARKANVTIYGNPSMYGAVISEKVTVPGNPTFFYDVALSGMIEDLPVIKVTSWTRY